MVRPAKIPATHVVLDIDNTLLCTVGVVHVLYCTGIMTKAEYLEVRNRLYVLHMNENPPGMCRMEDEEGNKFNYDGLYEMWGVIRPYCADFLRACFERFQYVIIWTAGGEEYATKVCKVLFKDVPFYPHLIWSFHDCQPIPKTEGVQKPLAKLAAHLGIDVEHLLLIDDNPLSAISCPSLMSQIKPFRLPGELLELNLTMEDAFQLQVNLEKPHHPSLMRQPILPIHKTIGQWLLKEDNILARMATVLRDNKMSGCSSQEFIAAFIDAKTCVPYGTSLRA
jgi:hypothetical protein